MNTKRISLNLLHFLQDHRQLSRIYINRNIQTIEDLEKHITNVFNIDKNFYLVCKNFYLPPTESIHLLDDNDLIYVMPNIRTESLVYDRDKKTKKSKKYGSEETETAEPVKGKKKKSIANSVEINENKDEEVELPKKKVKKSKKNASQELEIEVYDNNERDMEVSEIDNQKEICDNIDEKVRKRRRCISPVKENLRVTPEVFSETNQFRDPQTNEIVEENKEMETDESKIIVHSVEIVRNSNVQLNPPLVNGNSQIPDSSLDKSPNEVPISTKKSLFKQYRQHSGVGSILKLLNSENSANESEESISDNNFVTKRRRIRTRKRQKTKADSSQNDNQVEIPVFKPPKTKAAPKSHIKFTEEDEKDCESHLVHSTPKKLVNNNRRTTDLNKNLSLNLSENNLSLINIDPENCKDLTGVPQIKNVILFKKLKLGNDYAPTMSNFILAEVQELIENGEKLKVRVLDGHDELKEPMGRFSCIPEEEDNLESNRNFIILDRVALLEPKLFTGTNV